MSPPTDRRRLPPPVAVQQPPPAIGVRRPPRRWRRRQPPAAAAAASPTRAGARPPAAAAAAQVAAAVVAAGGDPRAGAAAAATPCDGKRGLVTASPRPPTPPAPTTPRRRHSTARTPHLPAGGWSAEPVTPSGHPPTRRLPPAAAATMRQRRQAGPRLGGGRRHRAWPQPCPWRRTPRRREHQPAGSPAARLGPRRGCGGIGQERGGGCRPNGLRGPAVTATATCPPWPREGRPRPNRKKTTGQSEGH